MTCVRTHGVCRLEWAVALWGNMKRLRKQRHLITDEKLIRFKRGCVKHNGTKAWCELDEYTLRFFHSAKVPFLSFIHFF
jgi:hypothetical protein